jgi:hypothetical protein
VELVISLLTLTVTKTAEGHLLSPYHHHHYHHLYHHNYIQQQHRRMKKKWR